MQEIGVTLHDNGARIRTLALKHMNDANEINIEIIEEWVAGKGKHPVTWKTLTEVLHDNELTTLAGEIEVTKEFTHCVHFWYCASYLVSI